ncbi:MAG: hypothetical protein LBN08_06320 [Lactobacillales bacterium]|jgi:hypothetical protein|nr:hypothetical protein [Lactobacillales bacterium]
MEIIEKILSAVNYYSAVAMEPFKFSGLAGKITAEIFLGILIIGLCSKLVSMGKLVVRRARGVRWKR